MDFFNKLGKKASETYQLTKEKTTKLSGELKLRGKISDIRDKIDETYQEIGAIVYSEIKTGNEISKDEIVAKCDEITKLFEDIEKAEAEILELKDIKKCEGCNAEIESDAEFCPKCGKEQPKVEKVDVEVKEQEPEGAKEAEVVKIEDVENETNPEGTDQVDSENTEE